MATKPTTFVDYAQNANYSVGPDTGQPTKIATDAQDIAEGNIRGPVFFPAAEKFNFVMNAVGRWVRWLDANVFSDSANEIQTRLSAKASLVDADVFLLEDSAAAFAKKKTTLVDIKTSIGNAGIFTNVAALAALSVSSLGEGSTAEVVTLLDQFELVIDATTLAAADAITIVAPGTPSGPNKVWVRRNLGNERWRRQVAWFVNQTSGDDESTGAATGAGALKTFAELSRRMRGGKINTSPTVKIQVDLAAGDEISFHNWGPLTGTNKVTVTGTATSARDASFTDTTDLDAVAKQPQVCEDTANGMALGVGKRIVSGGEIAWGLNNFTANELRTSPFSNGGLPGTTDAYSIETLTKSTVVSCDIVGGDDAQVLFVDMELNFGKQCSFANVVKATGCKVTGGQFTNCRALIFERCGIENCEFYDLTPQFEDCGFFGDQDVRFSNCRASFSGANGTEGEFNEKVVPPLQGDSAHAGNTFYIRGEFGVYNASVIGFYINENDVTYVDDNTPLWGPTTATRGIACLGKLYFGDTLPSLGGSTADVRLGELDRSYAQLATGLTDVDYGSVFQPRVTAV